MSLGPVVSVSEQAPRACVLPMLAQAPRIAAPSPVPVSPGRQQVTVTVTADLRAGLTVQAGNRPDPAALATGDAGHARWTSPHARPPRRCGARPGRTGRLAPCEPAVTSSGGAAGKAVAGSRAAHIQKTAARPRRSLWLLQAGP